MRADLRWIWNEEGEKEGEVDEGALTSSAFAADSWLMLMMKMKVVGDEP